MANKKIPPQSFYKLAPGEQEVYAVKKMNEAYEVYEAWKKLARETRKGYIHEPKEIDRLDLLEMK